MSNDLAVPDVSPCGRRGFADQTQADSRAARRPGLVTELGVKDGGIQAELIPLAELTGILINSFRHMLDDAPTTSHSPSTSSHPSSWIQRGTRWVVMSRAVRETWARNLTRRWSRQWSLFTRSRNAGRPCAGAPRAAASRTVRALVLTSRHLC
ncbi:hypothetical protein GCM10018965_097620 [Nonomuraea roseola]